jgi:hypothetical protein
MIEAVSRTARELRKAKPAAPSSKIASTVGGVVFDVGRQASLPCHGRLVRVALAAQNALDGLSVPQKAESVKFQT